MVAGTLHKVNTSRSGEDRNTHWVMVGLRWWTMRGPGVMAGTGGVPIRFETHPFDREML